MFWTFALNGEHDSKPEAAFTYPHIVPSAAEKQGNFSDLLNVTSDGLNYQLFDPLSVKVDPSRSGTHYSRNPIPGNILPASYMAMGAKTYNVYTKYWPNPNNWYNQSIAQNTGQDDYLANTTPYNWLFKQYAGRMDLSLGNKLRIFGRYTRNHFVEYRSDWTYFIAPGFNNTGSQGAGVTRDTQNGVLDFVYTVSPTTIIHAAGSVSNWDSYSTTLPYVFGFKPSDAGLPTYLDANCGSSCYLPYMSISGYSQNGISGPPGPQYNRFFDYNADVYHNRGNHQFRFGADLRQETRSVHNANNDGSYTFGNQFFRQYDDSGAAGTYNPATLGLSWASFEMGLPTAINISANTSYAVSNQFAALFAQDTWRVNPRLTLTLSIRAEFENGAGNHLNNWITGFNPGAQLPISQLAQAAYSSSPIWEMPASNFVVEGGPLYAGTAGAPSRAWPSQLMWLPRVGFGYQLTPKTVIRGGYGIYYDTLDVNALVYGANQAGFTTSTNTTLTTTQGVTWGSNGVSAGNPSALISPLTDPFPVRSYANNTRFNLPVGNSLGYMGLLGINNNNNWTWPASKHPRMQRWRIGIERQVLANDLITVGYTGAYTTDMNVNVTQSGLTSNWYYNGNAVPVTSAGVVNNCPAYVSNATAGGCVENTNLGANVTNPFYIGNFASLQTSNPSVYTAISGQSLFTSQTIAASSLVHNYPLGSVSIPEPIGKERETEFDAGYTHRFSRGLTGNFGYTHFDSRYANSYFEPWSPTDPTNPQTPIWQVNNIAPTRVTGTFVYDLPFGKSRRWVHSAIPAAIVGGWTISGTYQWQRGTLLQLPNSFYYGDLNSIVISNPTLAHQFNTAGCVATAGAAGPGDTVVPNGQPCTSGWEKRTTYQPGTYQARVLPYYVNDLRNPNWGQTNANIMRDIRINIKEHPVTLQLRGDVLNLMNHSYFGAVSMTPTSGVNSFGVTTTASSILNRFIQVQAHLRW